MSKKTTVTVLAATLLGAGALVGSALAQKQSVPKPSEGALIEQDHVQQQLSVPIVLDVDHSGRVSKKDWIDAAAKKFDRLDASKKGYVDAAQLTEPDAIIPSERLGK